MSKRQKRKRKGGEAAAATSSDLFHLTGVTGFGSTTGIGPAGGGGGSLEEMCLQELEGASIPTRTLPDTKRTAHQAKELDGGARTKRARSSANVSSSDDCYRPSDAERTMISNWNASFQTWAFQSKQNKSKYPAGLLPSFDVELARHFQIKELSTYLLQACSSSSSKNVQQLKMPSFERWLIDSKVEEKDLLISLTNKDSCPVDPILCANVTMEFESSQRLVAEMVNAGVSEVQAETIVRELCRRTRQVAIPEIQSQMRRYAGDTANPLKKGDRVALEDHHHGTVSLVYSRKRWKKPFCIKLNRTHFEKLRDRFLSVHNYDNNNPHSPMIQLTNPHDGKPTKAGHAFHLIVMSLVLRYSSLSGGQLLNDLRGGGMQGAIHGQVFDVLRATFCTHSGGDASPVPMVMGECFASPFNAHLLAFHSAFHDIDWHFGSKGDFWRGEVVEEGCMEANPPFSPGFMTAMVRRFDQSIRRADQRKKSLTFVVVVPTAGRRVDEKEDDDSDDSTQLPAAKRFAQSSFQRILSGSSCRLHIVLPAREHGYIEGAQHMRPTQYKDSSYDTSVIVLQSKSARKQKLDEGDFEARIREAFASRHTEELQKRREDAAQHDDSEDCLASQGDTDR